MDNPDFEYVGEQKVTLIATDESGNKTEKETQAQCRFTLSCLKTASLTTKCWIAHHCPGGYFTPGQGTTVKFSKSVHHSFLHSFIFSKMEDSNSERESRKVSHYNTLSSDTLQGRLILRKSTFRI